MPLTKGSTAITMMYVENPAKLKISAQTLKAHSLPAFQGEEKVMGLVPIDDPFDTTWGSHCAFGEFAAFALRIDKKTVPGTVLKKHYEKALEDELAKARGEGEAKVSRKRKKELKDHVKSRLLSKAEPVPGIHEIAINTATGAVYVASNSNPVIQHAREHIAFIGAESAERFEQKEGEKASEDVAGFLTEIVMHGIKGKDADIYACGKITVGDADTLISGQSKNDSEIKEIHAAIKAGKWVTDTGVKIDTKDSLEFKCSINGLFRLSGLKLPATEKDKGEGEQGFEALFLERMFLIEKCAGILLDAFDTWRRAK
jgi:DNA recombination-dependent growth factor C